MFVVADPSNGIGPVLLRHPGEPLGQRAILLRKRGAGQFLNVSNEVRVLLGPG